ncbi:helix-turn-helix domain-containing protein [Scandinavium sp. NPDC088450]|uniref:winged helix-turn-helix transcriptional regulator n=1 Tax=Scandinavium sp. NPDC088450 TaxID=3364514 RepID=UPI0038515EBC
MPNNVTPAPHLNQPTHYGLELIKHIGAQMDFSDCPKDWVLPYSAEDEMLCYVVTKGFVTLHRKQDDLLLTTLHSPMIIGLGSIFPYVDSVYIKTASECTLGSLPQSKAMKIVEEDDLWRPLANHLIALLNKLFTLNQQLVGPNAYEIVRTQLLYMMNEPDEYRESKFITQYIREKSLLSRSGIMKILSQLRQGGYIEIENGILKKVHKLPAKY